MKKLGLITDDMTGTMTCGVLLAKTGITACSYFSPENLAGADKLEAVIISANSRNLPPEQAKESVKRAYQALVEQGVGYFTKRIDTTFRGGIGYEVDALLEEMPDDTVAIMAATMPDTHRIVVGGYSVIDGVILTETGVAEDVLSPVTQAHIPTLMRGQSQNQVEEIGIGTVLEGQEAIARALTERKAAGGKIIVVDAITTEHLRVIAQAVYDLGWNVVCVDPGAFSQQLALCRGFGNKERIPKGQETLVDVSGREGKVLVVAGSATDVTRNQIGALVKERYVREVPVDAQGLLQGGAAAETEVQRAIAAANGALGVADCKVLVLETAVTGDKLVLKEQEERLGLEKGEGSQNINRALGQAVAAVLKNPETKAQLKGIYMTGGDTLVTVLRSLGAAGIRLVDTIVPQTNLGVIIGGDFEGTPIVGKGGLIGKEETVVLAINRLFYESY